MSVRIADPSEAEPLAVLINRAFEVEKFFIEGDRIDAARVRGLFQRGSFLVIDGDRGPLGCVYVEQRGTHAYLGLLSVDPARQGGGLGRRLMQAAGDHALAHGCEVMDLNIVSTREELLTFYRKFGYVETGTAPFVADATEKLKMPCHFITMSKPLRAAPANRHGANSVGHGGHRQS